VILLPVGEVNRPPAVIFWGFLYFTFLFSLRFERTPIKIKSLIFWAAANDVSRNSLAKSGIVSVISLASSEYRAENRPEYRAEKQTRREPLAAYLLLAHSS